MSQANSDWESESWDGQYSDDPRGEAGRVCKSLRLTRKVESVSQKIETTVTSYISLSANSREPVADQETILACSRRDRYVKPGRGLHEASEGLLDGFLQMCRQHTSLSRLNPGETSHVSKRDSPPGYFVCTQRAPRIKAQPKESGGHFLYHESSFGASSSYRISHRWSSLAPPS